MALMDKYKTLEEWARAYRKQGLNVIPLYGFQKSPQDVKIMSNGAWVNGWKELQTRQGTDEEMTYWFKETKPTGIGVITGSISGIIVVDVDSYKSGGMSFHLDSPIQATTGRGGTHYYFRYEQPIKNMGFQDGVYIEVKSDGGFIVMPPTLVWVENDAKKIGSYKWTKVKTSFSQLPVLKDSDLERYRKAKGVYHDMHDLVKAELGTQHNHLRTIALKVFARFPKSEWDLAAGLIRQMASEFNPPHPQKKVETLIKDTSEFIATHSDKEIEEFTAIAEPNSTIAIGKERVKERALERIAPQTGFDGLDRLIKGWVPGHLYTLTGETNVGKTTISCNFAIRVSRQGKKVLYYALEPDNVLVDYLASVRKSCRFDDLTDEDVVFEDKNIKIYTKEEINTQEELLRSLREQEEKFDLVIIDHIGYFIRSKDINIEQSNLIKELVAMAKERQFAVIQIAHPRKATSKKRKDLTMFDISGSAAFFQDATEVLIVSKLDIEMGDSFERYYQGQIHVAKSKVGPAGFVPVRFKARSAYIYEEKNYEASRKEEHAEPKVGQTEDGIRYEQNSIFLE